MLYTHAGYVRFLVIEGIHDAPIYIYISMYLLSISLPPALSFERRAALLACPRARAVIYTCIYTLYPPIITQLATHFWCNTGTQRALATAHLYNHTFLVYIYLLYVDFALKNHTIANSRAIYFSSVPMCVRRGARVATIVERLTRSLAAAAHVTRRSRSPSLSHSLAHSVFRARARPLVRCCCCCCFSSCVHTYIGIIFLRSVVAFSLTCARRSPYNRPHTYTCVHGRVAGWCAGRIIISARMRGWEVWKLSYVLILNIGIGLRVFF